MVSKEKEEVWKLTKSSKGFIIARNLSDRTFDYHLPYDKDIPFNEKWQLHSDKSEFDSELRISQERLQSLEIPEFMKFSEVGETVTVHYLPSGKYYILED